MIICHRLNIKALRKHLGRPEFSNMLLIDTEFVDPYCMGEAKGEDQNKSTYTLLIDIMRIGLLSKGFIDENLSIRMYFGFMLLVEACFLPR
jgi:hypothetical protein